MAALTEIGATLSASIKQRIEEGYTVDPFCVTLRKVLPLRDNCMEADGLLFVDGRLVIPEITGLQEKLIAECHRRLGHLGYAKTLAELRRDFFWPKMAKKTSAFVESCHTCQTTKAPTTAPPGKMKTPPVPQLPLQQLAIDFVGPLKSSNHFDMILTVTCRLTGFVRLIPTLQKDTAEKTASRFYNA